MLILCSALIAAFVLWCIYIWIRDSNRFVIVEYQAAVKGLKRPFTFLLLSDLHNKCYGKENEKLADAILKIKADAVIVAGDMYTAERGGHQGNSSYAGAVALLRRIAGKYPVYYANGNHEYKTRMDKASFGTVYEDYWGELESIGLQPLSNAHVWLPEAGLDICGLEIGREYFRHFQRPPFPDSYLEGLIGKRRDGVCQLLIAHNPDYFPEYAAWGADVVVSGHVHGGVVRLPLLGGVLSPALRLFPHYDGGIYREHGSLMILSRGLGMHTIPIRLWNPAELVVVQLVPKE